MSAENGKEELYLGKYRRDKVGYYNARLFDEEGIVSRPLEVAEGNLVYQHPDRQVDPSGLIYKKVRKYTPRR